MVLSVDPARAADPEIVAEGDRERMLALSKRFSREDLLRAFDLLARAENDIRLAAQPRYHLEMVLLRWIHLRKLVSIEDLIAGTASAVTSGGLAGGAEAGPAARETGAGGARASVARCRGRFRRWPKRRRRRSPRRLRRPAPPPAAPPAAAPAAGEAGQSDFKDAFLAEVRKGKPRSLQHVRRAGAEDRHQRRSRRVHVLAGPACAAAISSSRI